MRTATKTSRSTAPDDIVILDDRDDDIQVIDDPSPAPGRRRPARRAGSWLRRHRASVAILAGLVAVSGSVHAVGMGHSPQRTADEGINVARAWAVEHLGTLDNSAFSYDHPPLGWLQLALYTWVTDAFDRVPVAVMAGREAMLGVLVASIVLLWALARRLRLPRWSAVVAVALFSLPPLAVELHRTVELQNIATPWILAALVLAGSPKQRLTAFAGSGACFAVAVLTSETSLLVLPVLAWMLWRSRPPGARRAAVVVSGSVFFLVCSTYVVFATARGELVPGDGRPSLIDGVATTWSSWPGYEPLVIALLPLGAIAIAVAADRAWSWRRSDAATDAARADAGAVAAVRRLGARPLVPVVLATAVVVGVVATSAWVTGQRTLLAADPDAPMRDAEQWILDNVPTDRRLLVDDALWVDLVEAGFSADNVVGSTQLTAALAAADVDPGERPYDYVVSTEGVRTSPQRFEQAGQALESSEPAASFGDATTEVEIRRITTGGVDPSAGADESDARATRVTAGEALVANIGILSSSSARRALAEGSVDQRLLVVLAALAADRSVDVDDFPVVYGEADTVALRRTMEIGAIDGLPAIADNPGVADVTAWLESQSPPFRPSSVELDATRSVLRVTFPPARADAGDLLG